MPIAAIRRVTVFLFLIAPMVCAADWDDPLPTFNQSPVIQIFGLPAPDAARILRPGRHQARVSLEAANSFLSLSSANESLKLDGETHRVALTFKTRVGDTEWGVEVPYISQSGGFADDFVDRWHQFFGLPRGGRNEAPFDQLRYVYTRNGVEQLRLTEPSRGIGDVKILAAWRHQAFSDIDVALRTSLKLPTGDSAGLLGSGAPDLALWASAACNREACGQTFSWNSHAGALLLGKGDVLSEQQRRVVVFGGGGLAYRPWQPTVFKAELRAHSPFYRDTALKPLGVFGFQLILGGTWIVVKDVAVDIGVTEDIRAKTAPDVSFLLSVRADF